MRTKQLTLGNERGEDRGKYRERKQDRACTPIHTCVYSARQTVFNILLVTNRLLAVGFPMSELVLCWVVGSLSGGRISVFSSSSCWSSSASSATASPPPTTLGRLVAGGRSE